jgi:hypothetical protein
MSERPWSPDESQDPTSPPVIPTEKKEGWSDKPASEKFADIATTVFMGGIGAIVLVLFVFIVVKLIDVLPW